MYCNHKSMLDPAAIYVKINRIVSAIGKKSLWGFWPMNRICECYGALPMDRDNDRQAENCSAENVLFHKIICNVSGLTK